MQNKNQPRWRLKQSGEVNILLVISAFLLLATMALGSLAIYYISQYNQAQSTVDQQVAAAVATAKSEQTQIDEAEFAQRAKEPYRSYKAPQVLGDITVNFPKTWNVYAVEGQDDDSQLDMYFNPDIVPAADNYSGGYSLRVTLERSLYTEVVAGILAEIQEGTLSAEPIKVSGLTGTKYQGMVAEGKQGVKVVLPLRDKTLSLWTESSNYIADFNKVINLLKVSP